MRGVIYARYSEGPHQTDQSIEGQVSDCTEYAKQNDIDIIEVYADRHISGKSITGRDEFQRMLTDASAHKFDCVIVWKVDRFGRDRQDIALSKIKLKKAGVKLLYAKESVPDGPEGIILESLLEGLAEYYSADLRQKVIRGKRESAKKGGVSGAMPIGYKLDEKHHPVVVPEEAEAVREAFRLNNEGATIKEIVTMFEKRGIRGRRGSAVTYSTVYNMLRNEHYTGEWKVDDITVQIEPIIDRKTFEDAKKHFSPKKFNARGKAKVDYLLSCKVYCGYCGKLVDGVSGTGKSGKVYYYYKCSCNANSRSGHKCELKPVQKQVLEDAVIQETCERILNDETIDMLTERILEVQEAEPEATEVKILRDRLKENKKKQKNIISAIEEGSARGLSARLEELETEADDLSVQISKLELNQSRLSADIVKAWLHSFCNGDIDDPDFRQKLVDTFISRIELWNDHAVIYYNYIDHGTDSLCSHTVSLVDLKEWCSNTTAPMVISGMIILYIPM